MKTLLIAVNAKYIHSNLAVYSLKAYAGQDNPDLEIAEYTINHLREDILADIYRRQPDVAAFSCYLWNIEYIRALIPEVRQVLPNVKIWVGGPEVSYDASAFLEAFPQVELVMNGEGEKTLTELLQVPEGKSLEEIDGITWRDQDGQIHVNLPRSLMNLDEIPFMYRDLGVFENRIIYYESSRGCPFSCSYCMSSIDKKVRFRSLDLVKKELQFFLDNKVPQVKFVDRTFNCKKAHSMGIWQYIKEHDNGVTNFHFEISADLLKEDEISLLNSLRPGLVQLEVGVQSTNPQTLEAIHRSASFQKISDAVEAVHKGKNIHQHLDLIAGLPYENLESFHKSFNDVYALQPQQFQLGFLKVLKGSDMHEKAEGFGIVYRELPPYEVLKTRWVSYGEMLKLKSIEEMVEVYYNSCQFAYTISYLEGLVPDAYGLYEQLAEFYETRGYNGKSHSRLGRFQILREFALSLEGCSQEECEDRLLYDLYLRENSKSRPAWAKDPIGKFDDPKIREKISDFYRREAEEHRYLHYDEKYQARQLMHMTHLEKFHDGTWVLFDYGRRDPLTGDAITWRFAELPAGE